MEPFNYQNGSVFKWKNNSHSRGIQTLQVNRTRKLLETNYIQKIYSSFNPPENVASREVANLTERKYPHTPHMVSKNLSVCLSVLPNVHKNIDKKPKCFSLFRTE